jgi:uncharacterized protein (TIGR03435 family)
MKAALVAVAISVWTSQDAAQDRPTFEVASVKPAAPDAVPRNQIVPTNPGRLYIPSMTLSWLIYTAYGDGGFNTAMRVTGGPDWVNRTPYAVEAVASGTSTPRELRLMLQPLLEERFALKLRIEIQTIQTNTIVVDRRDGKLGPNVKEWDGTCRSGKPSIEDEPTRPRCPSGYLPGRLFLDGATMFSLAEALSLPQARPLVGGITGDRTGLSGRYTMVLDYDFSAGVLPTRLRRLMSPCSLRWAPPSRNSWDCASSRGRPPSGSSWSRARNRQWPTSQEPIRLQRTAPASGVWVRYGSTLASARWTYSAFWPTGAT